MVEYQSQLFDTKSCNNLVFQMFYTMIGQKWRVKNFNCTIASQDDEIEQNGFQI